MPCITLHDMSVTRTQISMRIDGETSARLRERANALGQPFTRLAEQYVEDGLRMEEHPGIYFERGSAGRGPMLMGTNLSVVRVIEIFNAHDGSIEETAAYLAKPERLVSIAVAYYRDHAEEVDAAIERDRELNEREYQGWLAERGAAAG